MNAVLRKDIRFEAAHHLPQAPDGHKCRRLHGHSYRVTIEVRGPVDEATGWVVDFQTLADAAEPVRAQLDHYYLNEIDGLANPTAEVLCRWFWERLADALPGLSCITVHETCTSACAYYGPTATRP